MSNNWTESSDKSTKLSIQQLNRIIWQVDLIKCQTIELLSDSYVDLSEKYDDNHGHVHVFVLNFRHVNK